MAVYTEERANDIVLSNMTAYRKFRDGVHYAWRIVANEGYVMYRPDANNTEYDPETGEEVPVIYYYTQTNAPLSVNWNNFPYIAVPRDSVDENYIFGLPEDEPEVM